jgi:hypothetical protein
MANLRQIGIVAFAALGALACPSGTAPAPEGAAEPATPTEPAAEPSIEGTGEAGAELAAVDEPEVASEPAPVDPMEAVRASVHSGEALSDEARALFWGSVEDDAPEVLLATRPDLEGRHYLTCDELNLHLWYERVRDIGGGYAGVGSDQAYTFIGWMKPDLAWFTDYDPWSSSLHHIYAAFFENGDDIAAFRAWWEEDQRTAARELLRERYADSGYDLDRMLLVYDEARYKVARRLRRLQRILGAAEIPSFVTDEATYQYVRTFIAQGRARPMLANLIDDQALRAVGDVGRQLDVPIRVFYLSNAEDYWRYPQEFRDNFQALHFDERSLILRTNAAKRTNGDYRYNSQTALSFQQWLQQEDVRRISDIWQREYIRDEDHIPVSHIDQGPEVE